jgi:plasmid stabilization system protein ParE
MKYSLSYFGIVKADLIEAREWYKNQKSGLDKEFEREVKQSINRLQKNPLGYEIKYNNIRTAFTDVFPYAIHFLVDQPGRKIVIIAIVHQTRNPFLGIDRSRNA